MSVFFTASAICPACEAKAKLDYPASVNADRRPDLRAAILDQSLFTLPCPDCGEVLTFEPHISYLDVARQQWILAEAVDEIDDWPSVEAHAIKVYEASFGAGAPPAARMIGARLTPRLVSGRPALIEKLTCEALDLDDIAIEALKLAILKDTPRRPLNPTLELRLVGRDEDRMIFAWLDPTTGAQAERMEVPTGTYALVKGDEAAWAPVTATLAGRMFVDMNRVLHGPDMPG